MTSTAQEEQKIPLLALIGVFGSLFAGYVGFAAAIPVLPAFVKDRLGAGNVVVGLVITATALTALLSRPLAGGMADRHGHRRVMLIGALIVSIGGGLYFLPLGVAGLVTVRLLLGLGEAALVTAGAVWTVSLAPHSRRGQLIGLYGVAMWGAISLGTLFGASLVHLGYVAVWAFCALAPLVAIGLISAVPEPRRAEPSQAGTARALALRPALLPGSALALAAAGYVGVAAFVALLLRSRGIGSGVIVLTAFSGVYAGTRLFIGHLPDKLGPRPVAAVSGAVEAAGLVIIAVAPDLAVGVLGGIVMGVGFSLLHPSLALMVLNRADKNQQGAALGTYTSFWDLGLAIWGPLIGVIASGFGYQAVFFAAAACAAAASGLALWIERPSVRPALAA
jgi:MFS family permease